MGAELMLNVACDPKRSLGKGDLLKGSQKLQNVIKDGSQAAQIRATAEQQGNPPPTSFAKQVHVLGGVQEVTVKLSDLEVEAKRIKPLATACKNCPGNILR